MPKWLTDDELARLFRLRNLYPPTDPRYMGCRKLARVFGLEPDTVVNLFRSNRTQTARRTARENAGQGKSNEQSE